MDAVSAMIQWSRDRMRLLLMLTLCFNRRGGHVMTKTASHWSLYHRSDRVLFQAITLTTMV